ncbi:MAG TPA: acyltransferase [Candidatus Acidoferrum sp.]|jgi:peptidoglycan/LPS O-acetylase OafA/YrhL
MVGIGGSQQARALKNNSSRIPELDGLRGLAILMVMLWHYFYFHPAANHHPAGLVRQAYVRLERFLGLGWSGVDLFFVLSGFLIGGILLNARSSPSYFRTFYLRRFFRIIPVYYAWILTYLLVSGLLSAFARQAVPHELKWTEVLAQFLFLQNLGIIHYLPSLGAVWFMASWSLAVEEQFYLVSPLIIRKFSEQFLLRFLVAVIVAAPILRLWIRFHYPSEAGMGMAYELMPCRADSLAVGILIALIWRKPAGQEWIKARTRQLAVVLAVLFAGFIVLTAFFSYRYLLLTQIVGHSWLAFFYGGALTMAVARPEISWASFLRTKVLRNWGRISYCVYLIHPAMNAAAHWLLRIQGEATDWRTLAAPTLAIPLTYAVASFSWRFFEEPMLRLGHRYQFHRSHSG